MTIRNTGKEEIEIDTVSAKKYKLTFNSDGDFRMNLKVRKKDSELSKNLTKDIYGIMGNYNVEFKIPFEGILIMKFFDDRNSWKKISNIEISEVV